MLGGAGIYCKFIRHNLFSNVFRSKFHHINQSSSVKGKNTVQQQPEIPILNYSVCFGTVAVALPAYCKMLLQIYRLPSAIGWDEFNSLCLFPKHLVFLKFSLRCLPSCIFLVYLILHCFSEFEFFTSYLFRSYRKCFPIAA